MDKISQMGGWTYGKNSLKKNFSSIWYAMRARCFNPLHKQYKDYGGRGFGKWSLDHIIPCNKFDLSLEDSRKECYNYLNLQPMWWIDNIKKGGC